METVLSEAPAMNVPDYNFTLTPTAIANGNNGPAEKPHGRFN